MGYRLYLGSIPKKGMRKFRKATPAELNKEFKESRSNLDYYSVTCFPYLKRLIELGKYCNFMKDKEYKNFFSFESPDNEFYVVDKEFLAAIIEEYRECVHTSYLKMDNFLTKVREAHNDMAGKAGELASQVGKQEWDGDDAVAFMNITQQVHAGEFNWRILDSYGINRPAVYDLEKMDDDGFISTSWRFEYAIFNLIHLYKTFNFKKNYLIYYGY